MSSIAVHSKPWRRWWRRNRHRSISTTPVKVLAMIGLLLAIDQYTKAQLTTDNWAWHNQPASWLVWPVVFTAICIPLLLHPITRLAAIFTLSGTLGNLLSEVRFDTIANPVQIQNGTTYYAFNFADVLLFTGFVLAIVAVVQTFWNLIHTRRQT